MRRTKPSINEVAPEEEDEEEEGVGGGGAGGEEEEEDTIMTMESILTRNYFILQNLIGNLFLISQFVVYSFSQACKVVMIAQ